MAVQVTAAPQRAAQQSEQAKQQQRRQQQQGGSLRQYAFTFCLERVERGPYKVGRSPAANDICFQICRMALGSVFAMSSGLCFEMSGAQIGGVTTMPGAKKKEGNLGSCSVCLHAIANENNKVLGGWV